METKLQSPVKGQHAAELTALTKKLDGANTDLQNLSRRDDLKKIIEFIRKQPGWTTPAEFAFANGIANNVISNVKTLQNQLQEFAQAASLVKEM